MKPFLLVSIMFVVTGCASSEVMPVQAESAPATEERPSAVAALPGSGNEVSQEERHAAPATPRATDSASVSASVIESLEAPQVTKTPSERIPGALLPEDAVECEQTTRPGSILPVRVCNDKRAVDARRAADQELFDNIKRNTALFANRL